MAAAREATGQTDRRVLLGALLALGFVTGVAFGRAFAGAAPSVILGLTGVVSVAVAASLAHRGLGLSLAAGVGALALLMTWLIFPETSWFAVPTGDTLQAFLRALERSTDRVATEVAPAPPLDALMVPAMLAVWAATTSAHALAARSRGAILPLLPCAALLAFAGVVAEDGSRPAYVALFLAAALAVVYGSSLLRLRSWGPSVGPTGRWGWAGLGPWARRLGAAAVLVALAVPGALPGFGSRSLLRVDAAGSRVAVNPFVDIRPSLLENPPAHLFTVQANRASYWRMLSLDRFDGRVWSSSDLHGLDGISIQNGSPLGGLRPADPAPLLHQEFEIEDLSVPWLPAAYHPTRAAAGQGRWDGGSATLFAGEDTQPGFRYEIISRVPLASPVELDEIEPPLGEVSPAYTELPSRVPARVHEIARALTADEPTAFRELLAIQEHLRTFEYDEEAPAGHGVDDMLFFLEQSRRGYCEQFAGTMAVLARSLGYPARVAIGFLPGEAVGDDTYRVTSDHVHAWTEVYFGPYGWLAFEPTPTRENPVAGYLTPPPSGPRPDANLGAAGADAGRTNQGSRGASQRDAQDLPRGTGLRGPVPASRPIETPSTTRRLLPIALAIAAVVLLLIPPAKLFLRRRAFRTREEPREAVLSAYRVVLWSAEDLGLGRHPGETPWEYRSRLRSEVAFSDGDLERLTGLAGRALYAADGVRPEDGATARASARALLRDLRRHAGPGRVVAGAFRPSRPD